VIAAVNFKDEAALRSEKVDDEAANGNLAPKAHAELGRAKSAPESLLRRSSGGAQSLCTNHAIWTTTDRAIESGFARAAQRDLLRRRAGRAQRTGRRLCDRRGRREVSRTEAPGAQRAPYQRSPASSPPQEHCAAEQNAGCEAFATCIRASSTKLRRADEQNARLYHMNEAFQVDRRSPSRVRRAAQRASTGAREAASRAQPAGRARRGWAAQDERADIRKELAKAERSLSRIRVRANPSDAQITVDNEALGAWSASEPWHVEAGEHTVSVKKAGYEDAERTLTTKAGEEQVVEVELTAVKSQETAAAIAPEQVSSAVTTLPPDEPQSEEKSVVPLIIGGGITALALAGGIGFRMAASSAEGDAKALDGAIGNDGSCAASANSSRCAELQDKFDSADRNYNLSTAGFVTAGVAAAATAVYYLWPTAQQSSVAVRPVPAIASGDARLLFVGKF
jgi:hypothetical protein